MIEDDFRMHTERTVASQNREIIMNQPLDPYKTILVLKVDGKEVGRKPAMHPKANDYIAELTAYYTQQGKRVDIERERDTTDGLLWSL